MPEKIRKNKPGRGKRQKQKVEARVFAWEGHGVPFLPNNKKKV